MSDFDKCSRCGESHCEWQSGPCFGLCRTCIENDRIGSVARIAELAAENRELSIAIRESRRCWLWRRDWKLAAKMWRCSALEERLRNKALRSAAEKAAHETREALFYAELDPIVVVERLRCALAALDEALGEKP